MSRYLLPKNKLEAFKTWLDANNIEHRPGRGFHEILQIRTKKKYWQAVTEQLDTVEHYRAAWPVQSIVRRFLRDERVKQAGM